MIQYLYEKNKTNEKEKRSRLYMRVSLGASYSDKKFDPIQPYIANLYLHHRNVHQLRG